jgi:hypothetical protein
MLYLLNVFLDSTAQRHASGPGAGALLPAHLWFKKPSTSPGGEWVPVADPVTLSKANDQVGFTLGDVYNDLSNNATYKVIFCASSGVQSPLDSQTTQQLADGSYPWVKGRAPIIGLQNPTDYVTAQPLALANTGTGFEFSVEVDDGSREVYYLDPKMIVDP